MGKSVNKVVALAFLGVLISGCVQLEVKPDHVVSDTIEAGKELYHTVKRKSNGEEERSYTHIVHAGDEAFDAENIGKCKTQIEKNVAYSSVTLSKILSESSEVVEMDGHRKIKCTIVAVVKAQAS